MWLAENGGTLLAAALVAAALFFALRKIRKDKAAGRHSCGGNGSGCAMAGRCHEETPAEKQ